MLIETFSGYNLSIFHHYKSARSISKTIADGNMYSSRGHSVSYLPFTFSLPFASSQPRQTKPFAVECSLSLRSLSNLRAATLFTGERAVQKPSTKPARTHTHTQSRSCNSFFHFRRRHTITRKKCCDALCCRSVIMRRSRAYEHIIMVILSRTTAIVCVWMLFVSPRKQ